MKKDKRKLTEMVVAREVAIEYRVLVYVNETMGHATWPTLNAIGGVIGAEVERLGHAVDAITVQRLEDFVLTQTEPDVDADTP